MNYLKRCFLGVFCLICLNTLGQRSQEAKKIEKLIANCVDKAMATSVYIIEYDTLRNKIQEGVEETNGFTGVVVSSDGHILTVSHAAMPNQVYQIRFPDGSKHIAVGLGRIGIQDKGTDFDMAMVKMVKAGKWPFAKMARSTDLKLNQPVISISYPGAFFKQMPNVRFGRISDIDISDGFIESSAKMEPGDSGGPLFDALGRVVGIHSWIKEKEDQNYDVPTDHFLKYWTALNTAKDYKELPAADDLPATVSSLPMETVASLEAVADIPPKNSNSVVSLTSTRGEQQFSILGTVIDLGNATYILSKSSMVINNPTLTIDNRTIPVHIIKRDKENDLVLLKVTEKLDDGIKLKLDTGNPDLQTKNLGNILISALPNGSKKVGILSALYTDMPLNTSKGSQPPVRHVSYEYEGGRSARSDGFKNILIHDAAIKSDECGGPVFNADGEFYGINIARRSRTSSIVMPVAALIKFIKQDQENTN